MATPTDPIAAAAALFSVLAHPGRLGVLQVLAERGTSTVSELIEAMDMEQSAMSHQLRVLRDARLVATERDGRRVRYRLDDHHVAHIIEDAIAHAAESPAP